MSTDYLVSSIMSANGGQRTKEAANWKKGRCSVATEPWRSRLIKG